jgi:hypothetical protein
MLKRYQMISIVYGGTGAAYAKELNDMIARRSEAERYPIASRIVMESVLTGDLLQSITGLFTQTQFCLAILTADDCCISDGKQVKRLRQNVVFELGMAVYRLGREKCILLSDFDPRDPNVELPSDLKGMDIKYFTAQDKAQVFGDVLDKLLQLSSLDNDGAIPRYDNLLKRQDYFVNYEDLFASCSHLGEKGGTAYLQGVLDYWYAECESFLHYEERCLYFLERIPFLHMFCRHQWVDQWLERIEKLLSQYKLPDVTYCGKGNLEFIRNLAFTVSAIMRLKLEDRGAEPAIRDYRELIEKLTMEPAEHSSVTNPLVLTVYYDYLGLLHMYLYDLGDGDNHLAIAIDCFARILDQYVDHTDLNLSIWTGFVGYNLARCYLKKYRIYNKREDAVQAQNLMLRASVARKRWLSGNGFHSSIRSALSYEYFICKIEQISAMKLLHQRTDEDIRQEFKRLEGELETYMIRDEQLERLCFVQDLLEQRQKDICEENALEEKLL